MVIVAGLCAWTTPVRATTVGLVKVPHPPAVTTEVLIRLTGELRSLGVEPRMLDVPEPAAPGSDGGSPSSLRPLAEDRGVDAVIALPGVPAPVAVEVWAADGKGRSVARRVSIDPDVSRAPQTVAIRAFELLRSCLLEIDLLAGAPPAGAKPDGVPPPLPSVVASRPAEASAREGVASGRIGVAAGAVVVFTTDGVGPAVLPCLRLDWRLTAAWLVQADLAGVGASGSVDGATGTARVSQDQALLGIGYRPLPGRRVRPSFSVSVGALHTSVQGQALPPALGHDLGLWSFLVDGGAGAILHLNDRWDLIAAAHVQAAVPYPAVRFVGQTVATAAAPNLLLGLTVEAWL